MYSGKEGVQSGIDGVLGLSGTAPHLGGGQGVRGKQEDVGRDKQRDVSRR